MLADDVPLEEIYSALTPGGSKDSEKQLLIISAWTGSITATLRPNKFGLQLVTSCGRPVSTDKLTPVCQRILPAALSHAANAFSQAAKARCLEFR